MSYYDQNNEADNLVQNKELEQKANAVGTGFNDPPLCQKKNARINIIGEIVKANNFFAESIYCQYELLLPEDGPFKKDYEDIFKNDQEVDEKQFEEWNITSSITHATQPNIEVGEDKSKASQAHFCFPFDFQLQVDEMIMKYEKFPMMVLQIHSTDSWNRSRVEGYGFCEIPKEPGFHEIEVQTWTPDQSIYTKIHSFFLGGSTKLKYLSKLVDTSFETDQKTTSYVNRINISTESKGSVTLRFNIAIQTNSLKAKIGDQAAIKQENEYKSIAAKARYEQQIRESHQYNMQQNILNKKGEFSTTRFQYGSKLKQSNY